MNAHRQGAAGLSLLELVIAMAIVAFALFGLISVITFTTRSNLATRQRVLAMRAAERKIEQMGSVTPFSDIFNLYKSLPNPPFPTTGFGVEGIEGLNFIPVPPNTNSQILRVIFPVSAAGNLDETQTGALMSDNAAAPVANFDLDGDGLATNTLVDPTTAAIIPVMVEVKWKGVMGTSQLVYRFIFLKKT